jgi:hypothetical protein
LTGADLAKGKAHARKLGKPQQALSKGVTHRALS